MTTINSTKLDAKSDGFTFSLTIFLFKYNNGSFKIFDVILATNKREFLEQHLPALISFRVFITLKESCDKRGTSVYTCIMVYEYMYCTGVQYFYVYMHVRIYGKLSLFKWMTFEIYCFAQFAVILLTFFFFNLLGFLNQMGLYSYLLSIIFGLSMSTRLNRNVTV